MVNDNCFEHRLKVPLTVIVAVIGDAVVFTVVKEPILPPPLAPNPIPVLLFVHVMFAPDVVLVKEKLPAFTSGQNTVDAGTERSGIGLILNCLLTVVVPHSLVTANDTV